MSNSTALAIPEDRKYDGKAMAALTANRRKFVHAMLEQGVNPKACTKAAAAAGLTPIYGYELMRDEGVLAALREEATKRLVGGALVGVSVLLEIAQTPGHKDQFRAAKDLAAINGFTAEQRIVVEHLTEDTKGQMRQIRDMAQQLNLDPRALIAAAGIVDAEFSDVQEQPEDTECDTVEVDTDDW